MTTYAVAVRDYAELGVRVQMERMTGSNLENAIFDLAFTTGDMPPAVLQTYQEGFPEQVDTPMIGVLAQMLPRVNDYQQLADEAKNLGLYPTGVLLTRLRAVRDACTLLQPCLLYAYLQLIDAPMADQLWLESEDTAKETYAERLVRGLAIIDEAIDVTAQVVATERARQARN